VGEIHALSLADVAPASPIGARLLALNDEHASSPGWWSKLSSRVE
jgi:hypothetical protein